MSGGMATAIAMAIYAAGVAPFAWMAVRPNGARALGGGSLAAMVAIGLSQTGLFHRAPLASADVSSLMREATPESQCQEVFKVLQDNGILPQPPGPEGLVVNGAAWDQLPPPVRDAVVACAENAVPMDNEGGTVEVIRR